MSRIGRLSVKIEDGVSIEIKEDKVLIKGPLGELVLVIPSTVKVEEKGGEVSVIPVQKTKQARSDHGTIRVLILNMIHGVKDGCKKELELVGMGYRAAMEGDVLVMSLGWNHPVKVEPPEGIKFGVRDDVFIKVAGIDKQQVGLWAAKIRSIKKPEPYKGKGIRYVGEEVRRKARKTVKDEA